MTLGTALSAGYSIAQLLGFISGNYPNIGKKIQEAKKLGYDINEIAKYFSSMSPSELESYENSGFMKGNNPWVDSDETQRKRSAYEKVKKNAPKLAGAVAAPLGAYVAYRALKPAVTPLVEEGLNYLKNQFSTETPSPGSPINPPTGSPQTPGQMATPQTPMPGPQIAQQLNQQVNQPVQQAMQPSAQPQIAQAAQVIPNQVPVSIFENLTKDIDLEQIGPEKREQLKFLKTISDKLQQEGKPITDPGFKRLKEKIDNILKGKPGTIIEETSRIAPVNEKQNAIVKDSIVNTPVGSGEVKAIGNGKALVEIDGKTHKINESDIEPPLFSDDDVADAYDRIMSVIPEEHRSGFIQWAGYDEDRNTLGFIPRGGKYEELQDITPREAQMIKEGKGVARTTGENREGLWVAGEDTRGGIISQIIWDRKKKKKAFEDEQLMLGLELPKQEKQDRGMKPIFDELAYAREKSRERDRAKKLAEKEKIKKDKDEAKKRKKQA